ncbi:MAG: L,D-transpeptidase [Microgenomates group bacterium]
MARKKSLNRSNPFGLIVLILGITILSIFVLKKSFSNPPCANSLSCKESLELNVENEVAGVFNGQPVNPPKVNLTEKKSSTDVLGETETDGEKHIYVDLTTQTLSAYQGDVLFMQVPVSTGKWGKTPTGEFTIWEKVRATKMSGGSGADYYYLPNVPFVMFFSNDKVAAGRGFSLHGAYWHNNFGHTMSHGCVNMRIVDAEKLYHWANPETGSKNITLSDTDNPGTKVTIYGESSN